MTRVDFGPSEPILVGLGACGPALTWARCQPGASPRALWVRCDRADWLVWLADRVEVSPRLVGLALVDLIEVAVPRARWPEDARRALELPAGLEQSSTTMILARAALSERLTPGMGLAETDRLCLLAAQRAILDDLEQADDDGVFIAEDALSRLLRTWPASYAAEVVRARVPWDEVERCLVLWSARGRGLPWTRAELDENGGRRGV